MKSNEVQCKEVVERITDIMEKAVTPRESQLFEEHLKSCIGCGLFLAQMEAVLQLAEGLADDWDGDQKQWERTKLSPKATIKRSSR